MFIVKPEYDIICIIINIKQIKEVRINNTSQIFKALPPTTAPFLKTPEYLYIFSLQ